MQIIFIQYIYLVLIILALVMLANKIRVAYPIILVLGGLALSLFSILSKITIDPELIFFIFLPPLLYEAAWQVSWKEFWKWRRVITSFAFPVVILTSCVVAFASYAFIPGFTLALGFLLGGIVSPPDAISATTIMRQVKIPKAYVSIVEGESLLNDASSLVVFRFALIAVITGQFDFGKATINFLLVIVMGALIGLAIALLLYFVHRYLIKSPNIEIVLTLVTPYMMYYFAERFHFSGVLAVVCGGLFLSSRRQTMLTYKSRLQGFNVWSNLVFALNGLVFLLIGLQLPSIIQQLGDTSLPRAIWYGLAISFVLIIARFLCTFGAAIFTRFISRYITVADANPGWKGPIILGWSGMRGVVSLAAALALPLALPTGRPFPGRDYILFVAFSVILVTLVLQGLTLPVLIRRLGVPRDAETDEEERLARLEANKAALKWIEDAGASGKFSPDAANRLRAEYDERIEQLQLCAENPDDCRGEIATPQYQRLQHQALRVERKTIIRLRNERVINDDALRRIQRDLDLAEARLTGG